MAVLRQRLQLIKIWLVPPEFYIPFHLMPLSMLRDRMATVAIRVTPDSHLVFQVIQFGYEKNTL
jgi:hypothetical protein